MSAAFTPGPWSVDEDGIVRHRKLPNGYVEPVKFGSAWREGAWTGEGVDEVSLANARLIAAAPDLYEALLLVSRNSGKLSHQDWQQLETALAKARGEQ